jgi:predicted kinase
LVNLTRGVEQWRAGLLEQRFRHSSNRFRNVLVLVTGLPGSGKTTLARGLAGQLSLPLISKDHYKELLFDALGTKDLAWSRQIGQAAVQLQFDAIRVMRSVVVDSALWSGISEPEVMGLELPLVQAFCTCPFELARQRFFDRIAERHPGFVEEEMKADDFERFRPW